MIGEINKMAIETKSGNIILDLEGQLKPRETYTDFRTPIFEALVGWEPIVTRLAPGNYFVVFESTRKQSAMNGSLIEKKLEEADAQAYREVSQMPGFRGYYRGQLDIKTRKCRSFCVWENEESARASGKQPKHQEAIRLTNGAYEQYDVKRYVVIGVKGSLRFEQVFPRRDQTTMKAN